MAVPLIVNNVTYQYPEEGDTNWGQVTTQWAQAVTSGMLQRAGGVFPLTANVDFGGNYGLIAPYYYSRSSNASQSGVLRLAASDQITWRNTANSADLPLTIDVNDQLTFNGGTILPISVTDSSTIDLSITSGDITASVKADSLTNAEINSAAAIAYSKLALTGAIVNADVSASAAIARSKLATGSSNCLVVNNGLGVMADAAAITASRALASDSNGIPVAATTTTTELNYMSGVTSAVQTQIDSKLNLSGGTMLGNLILNADPTGPLGAATKQYVDAALQGLQVKTPAVTSTTTNITLSGEQTLDGVLTSNSRVLVKNQTNQTENGVYVTSSGAWTRSTDMDTWSELLQAYIFVQGGATQAFAGWYVVVSPGGTIGVDDIPITQFSQAGQITTDGQGLQVVGVQVSLVLDGTTLSKSPSGLKVNEIANAQIATAAAIARSKIATGSANRLVVNDGSGNLSDASAITAARALISDANGIPTQSAVTSTELGYVSGVTSAIQTQLGTKLTDPMTTNGDLITRAAGVPARLGIGSTGQVLRVVGGAPAWSDQNVNPATQSVSGNVTLAASDTNKYFFVNTSATRSFQLPAPAAGLNFIIKDATGQAATNPITLVRASSEQIEGVSASKLLQTNWGSWRVISDGTNWFLV